MEGECVNGIARRWSARAVYTPGQWTNGRAIGGDIQASKVIVGVFSKRNQTEKKTGGGTRLRGGGEKKNARSTQLAHRSARSATHLRTLSPGGNVTSSASILPMWMVRENYQINPRLRSGSVCERRGCGAQGRRRKRRNGTQPRRGVQRRTRRASQTPRDSRPALAVPRRRRPNVQQLSYGGRDGRRHGSRRWGKKRARRSAWRRPKESKNQALYASAYIVAHAKRRPIF